jgi:methyl-accepting chemotaxis protein
MPETIPAELPRHQSGGLAVALAKLNLDALTVSDAVADVASMAGENVTTTLRADFKGVQADLKQLRAETNGRIDTLTSETNAQFREVNARIDALTSETAARFGEVNAKFGETNARIDTVAGAIQSLQREIGTLRWMIGVGFTVLSVLVGLATLFLRFGGSS